jgi:hypothetical protein
MGDEPEGFIILTDEDCDACQVVKQALLGKPGIEFVDVTSEKADALLGDVEQVKVPMFFVVRDGKPTPCELVQDPEAGMYLVCDGKAVALPE